MRIAIVLATIVFVLTCVKYISEATNVMTDPGFWTMLTAWATVLLAFIAIQQISAMRRENRNERTLQMCMLYDIDPIIHAACERLALARVRAMPSVSKVRQQLDLITVLNYFESVAIGLRRGLYDEQIVEEHLRPIMIGACKEYLRAELFDGHPSGTDVRADYPRLSHLIEQKWGSPLTGVEALT